MRGALPELRRQYLLAVLVFAGLLLATFALFAHLLTNQFSRSYLEDILLSGRAQAEDLAKQMKGEGPLYKVVESRRVALAKVSAALAHQEVIDSVKVVDERGKLVWQTVTRTEGYTGGFPEANLELATPPSEPEVRETTNSYEIRVPLEDLGTVVYSLRKEAVAGRVAILQRRLLWHTAVAAGVGLSVLAAAVFFIWHLVQRNAQLETRKRLDEEMATLGSLAANLAHEIRNPLNALSINLELLEEDLGTRAAGADSVVLARREVGRLSRLVNDFLVYARPASPTLDDCDAASIVEDVERLLASACERANVELSTSIAPARLLADRGQISQVLVNLALNAVQAMEFSSARKLLVSCREDGERVTLEVRDTGPGIPDGELDRVRQAFYSLRKGGTGLGLAIAERIVAGHGGSLELVNLPEGGLVARVTLPAAQAAGRVEGLKG
jgi:signal transduction histidine kinase